MGNNDLDRAPLIEIAIDPAGPVLRIVYSIPDQGGTQLLYEFTLPCSANEPAVRVTGYAHESVRNSAFVALEDLPGRVVRDARSWLAEQIPRAEAGGKGELAQALNRFRKALSHAAA